MSSFNQIFSRLGRIARSYGGGGAAGGSDLQRAQELIDEARRREEAMKWDLPAPIAEDSSYREACILLELQPGATLDDAAAAYRRSIVLVHPDRTAHLPAEERERARHRTNELNRAYTIIKEYFAVR